MPRTTVDGVGPIKGLIRPFRAEFERRIAEHKGCELLEAAE